MTCPILQTLIFTGLVFFGSTVHFNSLSFVLVFLSFFFLGIEQVGRAGRFGTKGLAITFVSSASDSDVLNQVGSN